MFGFLRNAANTLWENLPTINAPADLGLQQQADLAAEQAADEAINNVTNQGSLGNLRAAARRLRDGFLAAMQQLTAKLGFNPLGGFTWMTNAINEMGAMVKLTTAGRQVLKSLFHVTHAFHAVVDLFKVVLDLVVKFFKAIWEFITDCVNTVKETVRPILGLEPTQAQAAGPEADAQAPEAQADNKPLWGLVALVVSIAAAVVWFLFGKEHIAPAMRQARQTVGEFAQTATEKAKETAREVRTNVVDALNARAETKYFQLHKDRAIDALNTARTAIAELSAKDIARGITAAFRNA